MAKYDPIREHLATVAQDQHSVELKIAEFERLVGRLPSSATLARAWWANNSNSQAKAWRDAGWHVERVDLATRVVRFARGRIGGSYEANAGGTASNRTPTPLAPHGEVVGSIEATVRFEWNDRGEVTSQGGTLVFPKLSAKAGLYRLELSGPPTQRQIYIGESGDLRRRMNNYRRPPARAQTSVRIHRVLLAHLLDGGRVRLSTCEEVTVGMPGVERLADLQLKRERVLAEHAALLIESRDQAVELLNL